MNAPVLRHFGDHRVLVWCPGCEELHPFVVANEQGQTPTNGPCWDWDRNEETPTFSPSLLVLGGRQGSDHVCHSFLRQGRWEFLGDSTHALAGQTVDLPPLPDWLDEA